MAVLALLLLVPASHSQNRVALDPAKAITQYRIEIWTDRDGLPQKSINAITQTHDGYLWFGTQEGLVKFDGSRFSVFDKGNTGLRRNVVSSLLEDTRGTLWIGTRTGGIGRYLGGELTTLTVEDGLSSDDISALLEDRYGNVWIGTHDAGINRVTHSEIKVYDTSDGLATNKIRVLLEDRAGRLWIGTRDHGLMIFDGNTFEPFDADRIGNVEVTALHEDAAGDMWVAIRDVGLWRYAGGNADEFSAVSELTGTTTMTIREDRSGNLWLALWHGGLVRYDGQRAEALTVDTGLPHDLIRDIFTDREGSLWVGTDGGGVARLLDGKFTVYTTEEGLSASNIYGITEDETGKLWIGTEGGGISFFDGKPGPGLSLEDGLSSDVVYTIAPTSDGSVWIGTRNGGLQQFKDGRVSNFNTANGFPSNTIYALYEDSKKTLWIGPSRGGLVRYDDGEFTTIDVDDGLSSNFVTVVGEDGAGNLLVGTYDGGLNIYRDDKVIAQYTLKNGLQSNYVLSLYTDDSGVVWIGTREGGLHRLKDGLITSITSKDGLFDDLVSAILEDEFGYLWMTCNKGIFRVSKAELNSFADGSSTEVRSRSFDRTDGLITNEFNGGFQPAGWRSKDGRLWFPSTNGLVAIDPANLPINEVPPIIVIEEFQTEGRSLSTTEFTQLDAGSNNFGFRYAGLSFIAPERVRYQYRLEGFDEDWIDAGGRREAFYTNLPPGDYTFRVRAQNNDGIWSSRDAVVSFYVRPFFYQTIWFYLLCALTLVVLSVGMYRLRVRQLKARHRELEQLVAERTKDLTEEKEKSEAALQQTEEARREAEEQKDIAERSKRVIEAQAQQLREMDRIKTRFFGNISHEFRTPLTLTIGPLENALTGQYGTLNPALRRQMEIMLRNSRRLLRLINQLLDLSKLESGHLKLKVRNGDILEMLEGVVLSFTAFAEKEGINLQLRSDEDDFPLYFDPENLEKVFFNLLSNAVKFTPAGGDVDVRVVDKKAVIRGAEFEVVEILIKDSGVGIPKEELPYIFDRFHQVDGSVSRVQEGTGIGLSLVKELVELHGGAISVRSEIDNGTEFIVHLPRGTEHLGKAEIVDDADEDSDLYHISHGPMMEMAIFDDEEVADVEEEAYDGQRSKLLVVDDNTDIRNYVVGCLHDRYEVVVARDGIDGLDVAAKEIPDLIISDVMMPRMDGYGLCRALKADPKLNHIPVILLTSKASIEAKIEGLEAGSDDYIAKPFNAKELRVRVANLLSIRSQQKLLKSLNTELTATNGALREANDLKSQLLNIASHDMKNPLTAIREFARILSDEVGKESHMTELLELIYSSSNEMLALVTALLDSAALENGKLKIERRPIDLSAIAQTVVHRNSKQAEKKGQNIVVSVAEQGECLVEGDDDRLMEAMDNLVSNAIKYSPLNESIKISVSRLEDTVRFEVKDNGPGISEDDQSKLFGKFQKLSAQPTGGESSTGLGLSIVKQIIDLHGGEVIVDTAIGEGSIFGFQIRHLSAVASGKAAS